jgi:hypothetical protein
MKIVRDFSHSTSSSLTAYLHLLRDMTPIVVHCLELRHMIADRGLLRLFFILMRCCNRSEPSNVLLSQILHFLQLFTVKSDLTLRLITRQEQMKDFNMLILKYYQNNGYELFTQICSLLQSMVTHVQVRRILRTNKSFTDAVEYVYKRLFNKMSIDDRKCRQRVRSTSKQTMGTFQQRLSTTTITRSMPSVLHDNVFAKNLTAIEKFMRAFYCD